MGGNDGSETRRKMMTPLVQNYMVMLIFFIVVALSGCATTQDTTYVVTKREIPIPAEPNYPVYSLKDGDTLDLVLKSYVATTHMCISYTKELKPLINLEVPNDKSK